MTPDQLLRIIGDGPAYFNETAFSRNLILCEQSRWSDEETLIREMHPDSPLERTLHLTQEVRPRSLHFVTNPLHPQVWKTVECKRIQPLQVVLTAPDSDAQLPEKDPLRFSFREGKFNDVQ